MAVAAARRFRSHLSPLRQLPRRESLQLGRPRHRPSSAVRILPADAHDSRARRARPSRGLVQARSREAAPRLHADGTRPAARQPRRRSGAGARVRVPRGFTAGRAARVDRTRERRHHHQCRGSGRCGAREAAARSGGAVSHAARAHASRGGALLLGSPDRADRSPRVPSATLFGDERAGLRSGAAASLRAGAARRLAESFRQRLRERARVGGLGRVVGPLSAHDRHARNRGRLRRLASVRAAPTSRRSRKCPRRRALRRARSIA